MFNPWVVRLIIQLLEQVTFIKKQIYFVVVTYGLTLLGVLALQLQH